MLQGDTFTSPLSPQRGVLEEGSGIGKGSSKRSSVGKGRNKGGGRTEGKKRKIVTRCGRIGKVVVEWVVLEKDIVYALVLGDFYHKRNILSKREKKILDFQ